MIKIPPATLPSHPETKISLRDSTVGECIEHSDLMSTHEERLKTSYLNLIQDKATRVNSADWSIDDRAFVLWWHWTHTREHSTYNLRYKCGHCDEHHDFYFDQKKMSRHYQSIKGAASRDIEFKGQAIEVHPLTGRAAEQIETASMMLKSLSPGTSDYLRAEALLDLLPVIHMIRITSRVIDLDWDKTFKEHKQWVLELSTTEFEELEDLVIQKELEMSHGIGRTRKGITLYWESEPHQCPATNLQEGNEKLETSLSFPFSFNFFLPRILQRGLENNGD